MSNDHGGNTPERWLEVNSAGERPKTVHCPRRGRDMALHECLGCARYASLAMDPTGKHIFIDCAWEGDPSP